MCNFYEMYPCPYYVNTPMYNPYNMYYVYGMYPCPYCIDPPIYNSDCSKQFTKLKDYGPEPFVVNIEKATKRNNTYRTALWTGDDLQVTLMSIKPGEDIGLEVHPKGDQFIRIEEGQGLVKMGDSKDKLDYQRKVYDDYAIMIPAGKWHNVINTGDKPLKLYAIYGPPEHPRGTVHETKADAEAAEENYGY
ncbi:cupin domain-containing protein [Clostridium ganghwense]|uniref:Cupin domain-containing protein n=1 Tax=Clostridium ganghwense TaxID=312089 RepID=A0ABT4CQ97_9CLOT|nr:cupin domain-containing protein [Clostridium ganghwense]MCY6371222.1 cupin domain-containing protein [Clostridium ganghwense]